MKPRFKKFSTFEKSIIAISTLLVMGTLITNEGIYALSGITLFLVTLVIDWNSFIKKHQPMPKEEKERIEASIKKVSEIETMTGKKLSPAEFNMLVIEMANEKTTPEEGTCKEKLQE